MTRLLWALGPRGRLLANRLAAAEGGNNRVLVLEAGGSDLYPWVHIPIGYVFAQNNPRLCWCFSTVEQPGLNGRAIGYPRGRVVGGCSSITGMIYQRGQVGDYDIWAEATGDSSWAWENFQRHFDGVLDSGEWTVSRQRVRWDMLDDFNKARDRFRGRIHRSHYAQIQYSAYLFELATDCRVADVLYDVTLIPDCGGDPKTAILRIPVDRVYGRWLAEEAKKLWMTHKSVILDAKRLPFIFQPSTKKVARKKRLTRRHGGGGRKKKDKKADTSETKAMDIAQTTEPTPAVNKTETRHGKIAKPLSQSGWTEDERQRYKKEQELLPDDFDVDRTPSVIYQVFHYMEKRLSGNSVTILKLNFRKIWQLWRDKCYGYAIYLNIAKTIRYGTLRKIFSLCDYQYCFSIHNKVTYKAIDPGVKTLLSCCTLFVEEDVRTTKYAVSSKEYHEMIKSAMRRLVSLELSKRVLSEDVYERLKVLSSKAAVDESYEEYLNYVQKHLSLILELQNHTKLKKLRFLGFCLRKKAIAKIANELARPRPGHEKTILILGDGSRNGGFSGARGHARGPTNAIFNHIQLHKLAITVWQDEFRTSALSITGHIARHP
eukprot:g693.t1